MPLKERSCLWVQNAYYLYTKISGKIPGKVPYWKVRYLSITSLCAECRHPTHLTLGTLPVLNAMGTSPGTLVFCTCLECFSCYLPAVLS